MCGLKNCEFSLFVSVCVGPWGWGAALAFPLPEKSAGRGEDPSQVDFRSALRPRLSAQPFGSAPPVSSPEQLPGSKERSSRSPGARGLTGATSLLAEHRAAIHVWAVFWGLLGRWRTRRPADEEAAGGTRLPGPETD